MDSSRVGQPYVVGRTEWPEGAGYMYATDGHVLTIFMRSPGKKALESIRKGKCHFALVLGPGIFFLMYRLGKAMPWSAAPYWGTMLAIEKRTAPAEGWPEGGVSIQVVLVDTATGIVRAARSTQLPPGFACKLHEVLRQHALLPALDRGGYDAAREKLERLCPTSRRMLQLAIACTGSVPRGKLVHRVWLREQRLNLLLDLLNWYSIHSDEKRIHLYADNVKRLIEAELMGQGFMRVDRTYDIR